MEIFDLILIGSGALVLLTVAACLSFVDLSKYAVQQALPPACSQFNDFGPQKAGKPADSQCAAGAAIGYDLTLGYDNIGRIGHAR